MPGASWVRSGRAVALLVQLPTMEAWNACCTWALVTHAASDRPTAR
jgi:hypothetical protein